MSINRANRYLGEIIEILDNHRGKYVEGAKGDDEARASLSGEDNKWIDDEIIHCITEPRYFLSNYYAIKTEGLGFQGLYPFFDSQEIIHDELRKMEKRDGKVRAIILKARRLGYTTYMIGEFLHKTIFWNHADSIIVSQDERGAKYNMGMYESAFEFLPWWMKPRVNLHQTGALYNFDEPDENLRMMRPGLKSWVYADNANRPSGVGRGQGYRRAVLDELSSWREVEELTESLLPTFNADDGFYVMGSTAKGRNNPWHELWKMAESGEIDWNPIFIEFYRRAKTYSLPIPKDKEFVLTEDEKEMRATIVAKKKFIISNETFNWMRKTKKGFEGTHGDDLRFYQEYPSNPEEAFQSSAVTAIPRGIINRYSRRVREPQWIGEVGFDFNMWEPELRIHELKDEKRGLNTKIGQRLSVWKLRENGARYCVGADVALGKTRGDYSCCQVVKLGEGMGKDELVATWHGHIDPYTFADTNLALCVYYNNALSAIEVNGMGMATFARMYREYEYDNVYIYKRMDRLKNFKTDIGGWYTNYNSKKNLIARLAKEMGDDQIIIYDRYFIEELKDFEEDGAEEGHDDRVMAMMIAIYCGHEGEFQEIRQRPSSVAKDRNNYIVYKMQVMDGMQIPVKLFQSASPFEAEQFSKKRIGSYIVNEHGAMADLVLKRKNDQGELVEVKKRVPADFQNTAYSPIHDKPGTRQRMFDEGIPAEMIDSQSVGEFESRQEDEELVNDSESWKWQ
jgi:hypothetical protein